jgi:RNA-binding protein YhbY
MDDYSDDELRGMRDAKQEQIEMFQSMRDNIVERIDSTQQMLAELNHELYERGAIDVPIDVESLNSQSPKEIVRALEQQSADGALVDVVLICFREFGYSKEDLDTLLEQGEVYEPTPGRLRTT